DQFHLLRADARTALRLRVLPEVVGVAAVTKDVWAARVAHPWQLERVMDSVRITDIAHHAYIVEDEEFSALFLPTDSVFISFRANVAEAGRNALTQQFSLTPVFKYSDTLSSYRVTNETGINPLKLCKALLGRPEIEYIEPDFLIEKK